MESKETTSSSEEQVCLPVSSSSLNPSSIQSIASLSETDDGHPSVTSASVNTPIESNPSDKTNEEDVKNNKPDSSTTTQSSKDHVECNVTDSSSRDPNNIVIAQQQLSEENKESKAIPGKDSITVAVVTPKTSSSTEVSLTSSKQSSLTSSSLSSTTTTAAAVSSSSCITESRQDKITSSTEGRDSVQESKINQNDSQQTSVNAKEANEVEKRLPVSSETLSGNQESDMKSSEAAVESKGESSKMEVGDASSTTKSESSSKVSSASDSSQGHSKLTSNIESNRLTEGMKIDPRPHSPSNRGHKRKAEEQQQSHDMSSSTSMRDGSPSSSDGKKEPKGKHHRHHLHHKIRRESSSPTSMIRTRGSDRQSTGASSTSSVGDKMNVGHTSSDSEDEGRMMIDEDAPDASDDPVSDSKHPQASSSSHHQLSEASSTSKPSSPNATESGLTTSSTSSPKVPPLRIVISKSASNSSTPAAIVSTASSSESHPHTFGQKVSSSLSNLPSLTSAKNSSHVVSSSSTGRESVKSTSEDHELISDDEASNTSELSGPTNESKTTARVTRSSQRVKELQQQHQPNDSENGSSSSSSLKRSHHNLRERSKGDPRDNDDESRDVTSPTSTCSKDAREEPSSNNNVIITKEGKESETGKSGRKGRKGKGSKSGSVGSSATPEKVTRSADKHLRSQNEGGNSSKGPSSLHETPDPEEDNDSTSSSTSSSLGASKDNNGNKEIKDNNDNTTNGQNPYSYPSGRTSVAAKEGFPVPSYNSYQQYSNIRRAIEKKRYNLHPVQPNPPKGFQDFLLVKGNYLLKQTVPSFAASSAASRIPAMKSPPPSLTPGSGLYSMFCEQEKARQQLRVTQRIEKEKLRLSLEQEILRVHGRAALAVANQTMPYSFCSIIKDDEVYNLIEAETENNHGSEGEGRDSDTSSRPSSGGRNEYSKSTYTNSSSSTTDLAALTGGASAPGSRSRFNGRLFHSWIREVTDTFERLKSDLIKRQKREAEALLAIQKLDWEWKMKELLLCDFKSKPEIDVTLIPGVEVIDDFAPLPTS
jgi:hypothetical protein